MSRQRIGIANIALLLSVTRDNQNQWKLSQLINLNSMTDKEKKSKIADILMDFQEEYSNEVINRPTLASLYAGNILSFIDSMQEEPVSIWNDASKKSDNPEDVVIINPSDNTGEVLTKCTGVNQGHIWAYTSELLKIDNPCNIGKNLQEPQVKESAILQHKEETCRENGDSLTQESVSEELEDAASSFARKDSEGISNPADFYYIVADKARIFKAGAKWKDEQIMAKAVDGEVTYGKSLAIPSLGWVLDKEGLDFGNKVKLIIIKED